jgi:hypothetical protein
MDHPTLMRVMNRFADLKECRQNGPDLETTVP